MRSRIIPVVVVVDEEGIVSLTVGTSSVGERHPLIAVVHRPHPELHCHLCLGKIMKVGHQQYLQRHSLGTDMLLCMHYLCAHEPDQVQQTSTMPATAALTSRTHKKKTWDA